MCSHKVLIAGKGHKILEEKLTNAGYSCSVLKDITYEKIAENLHKYEGLIVRSKVNIDSNLIDKGPNLKFIGRIGAGLENINISYAHSKNIKVVNSPEGNKDALAEHSVGMILSLMNNLNIADREVKNGQWLREENRGHEIKRKTVGIIGYGNMGSAFAQRLKGFETNVIAYDKYKTDFSNSFVSECLLNELFEKTDIFSINLPLTEETHFLISTDFISKFKKPIYLINTSRGKILKTDDLISSIKNGQVLGAALDVLEYESSSFEGLNTDNENLKYLSKSNKVILSPHIAGWSVESEFKLSDILADKIISIIN